MRLIVLKETMCRRLSAYSPGHGDDNKTECGCDTEIDPLNRKAAAAAVATNMYIHTYKRGTGYSTLRQTEKF